MKKREKKGYRLKQHSLHTINNTRLENSSSQLKVYTYSTQT